MGPTRKVIFLVYPTYSHYISMLPLAQKYKSEGFDVLFTGIEGHKKSIAGLGFKFITVPYMQSYEISNYKVALALLYRSYTSSAFFRERFREYLLFKDKLCERLLSYDPSLIVVDAHLAFYCIYFPDLLSKFVIFNTKLYTGKLPGLPPLNSAFIASRSVTCAAIGQIQWTFNNVQRFARQSLHFFLMKGRPEHQFVMRSLKKSRLPSEELFLPVNKALFHYEVNWRKIPVKKYVVRTNIIEYPWINNQTEVSALKMGPYVKVNDSALQPALQQFINDFQDSRSRCGDMVLVYCALGTMTVRYQVKCTRFYRKIINAYKNLTGYRLILSTGGVSTDIFEKYDNIYLSEQIPQHDILQYANLMITHGGLNSVMECIHFEVPMLVYPVNPHFDQKGNAARVAYHKIGLIGNLRKDSSKKLFNKSKDALLLRPNLRDISMRLYENETDELEKKLLEL